MMTTAATSIPPRVNTVARAQRGSGISLIAPVSDWNWRTRQRDVGAMRHGSVPAVRRARPGGSAAMM